MSSIFRGGISLRKLQATVINDIWFEVVFFSLVATMVTVVSDKRVPHHHNLGVSNALLTVMGTVLGLVISFRTSSAYERYQDGRKMWTNITTASRNLAQQIWIHVPIDRAGKGGEAAKATQMQNIIEKKSMINLILAFSVSVKHFLRDERGPYYADLYPLVDFLPKFANGNPNESERLPLWREDEEYDGLPVGAPATELGRGETPESREKYSPKKPSDSFDPEMALPQVDAERPLKPARNPPTASILDIFPFLRFFKYIGHKIFRTGNSGKYKKKKRPFIEYVESNIPLEIILVLSNYTAWCMTNGLLHPAIATGVTTNLTSLQDTLSHLERVCNTPIPFAYQVHLRMSLWLYLLFLPFQISTAFGYITIPATAFASFLFLGFLEIGQEIENPFNYDLNDLDLDRFCHAIQRELHFITAHTNPKPSEYIFSSLNQPFAPADRRSALELTQTDSAYQLHEGSEPGLPSIRRTLLKGWKDVDTFTRDG